MDGTQPRSRREAARRSRFTASWRLVLRGTAAAGLLGLAGLAGAALGTLVGAPHTDAAISATRPLPTRPSSSLEEIFGDRPGLTVVVHVCGRSARTGPPRSHVTRLGTGAVFVIESRGHHVHELTRALERRDGVERASDVSRRSGCQRELR